MRHRKGTEIAVGVVVVGAVIAASFSIFDRANPGGGSTYLVAANFTQAEGVSTATEVTSAGVPVGRVVDMQLSDSYFATVTMEIDSSIVLDSDASAQIVTEGLFGGKYIRLDIGGGEFTIEDGGSIFYVESGQILGELLEQIISFGRARRRSTDDAADAVVE